jgi:hypothetical protein
MRTAQVSEWVGTRRAAELLGVPHYKMQALVRQGLVQTLQLPRSRPKVSVADIERIKREALRPAVAV